MYWNLLFVMKFMLTKFKFNIKLKSNLTFFILNYKKKKKVLLTISIISFKKSLIIFIYIDNMSIHLWKRSFVVCDALKQPSVFKGCISNLVAKLVMDVWGEHKILPKKAIQWMVIIDTDPTNFLMSNRWHGSYVRSCSSLRGCIK